MNVLIDTNIIIPLEDAGRELDKRLAEIKRLSSALSIVFRTHPDQKHDIERDGDDVRKKIMLSRIEQYSPIPNPPQWSKADLDDMSLLPASDNDRVDNALLCAVYRNAVHLLLTEDKAIHRKAIHLGIQDRVYYIDAFLVYLRDRLTPQSATQPPLGIRSGYLHQFNLKNRFFDSLRTGYHGFDDWFVRGARENRECWYIGTLEQIGALVIRKAETDEVITQDGKSLSGQALKLCTFKVADELRGRKIGERLLYTAFQFAQQQRLAWVYLTIDGNLQKELETLCEDFGFDPIGVDVKGKRDGVWCKDMRTPSKTNSLSDLEYAVRYYPHYRKSGVFSKWLIPIRPPYHEMLFPDVSDKRFWFPEFRDNPDEYGPYANTIKKAYLCHSNVREIKAGDLVYFYRSQDRQSVQCVGIVEHSFRSTNVQDILTAISKRSVYSQTDVERMARKETLVILFRLLEYLIPPIDAAALRRGRVSGPIQSIRKLKGIFV